MNDLLQARLEEGVDALLERDHVLAVRDRGRALTVGDAAHGLVAELSDHEQAELASRVAVPLR